MATFATLQNTAYVQPDYLLYVMQGEGIRLTSNRKKPTKTEGDM